MKNFPWGEVKKIHKIEAQLEAIGAGGVSGPPLYAHHSPPDGMVGGWISVDERVPDLYKRVLVITTDADDEPYATPAHYNGPGKFLAAGGHRLNPVTHWQEIDAPPAGWKLPPAKPRVSHRRKPSPPTTSAGSGKGE